MFVTHFFKNPLILTFSPRGEGKVLFNKLLEHHTSTPASNCQSIAPDFTADRSLVSDIQGVSEKAFHVG